MQETNKKQQNKKGQKSIMKSFLKTFTSFSQVMPMFVGVILLMGLFNTFITKEMITSVFTGNMFSDILLGAGIGSISAGHPITSYIIGDELLKNGVSLFAITSFIVSWVTVGIIQYPMEASILCKRFAIARNVISFILAMLVSLATVMTLRLL